MGAYINPPDQSKESWLFENTIGLTQAPKWSELPEGHLPVVLIDNGMFTAAGIAYCEKELEYFKYDPGNRPKDWFIAEIAKLHEVSEELKNYLREPVVAEPRAE